MIYRIYVERSNKEDLRKLVNNHFINYTLIPVENVRHTAPDAGLVLEIISPGTSSATEARRFFERMLKLAAEIRRKLHLYEILLISLPAKIHVAQTNHDNIA